MISIPGKTAVKYSGIRARRHELTIERSNLKGGKERQYFLAAFAAFAFQESDARHREDAKRTKNRHVRLTLAAGNRYKRTAFKVTFFEEGSVSCAGFLPD
jgi:hypothetical protein